jgi:hypothetical protein
MIDPKALDNYFKNILMNGGNSTENGGVLDVTKPLKERLDVKSASPDGKN